jgi:hypothetical protein
VSATQSTFTFPGYDGAFRSAINLAELRRIASTTLEHGQNCTADGGIKLGDGLGDTYVYDASSVLADDGSSIIRPDDLGPSEKGRWRQVSKNTEAPAPVSDAAAIIYRNGKSVAAKLDEFVALDDFHVAGDNSDDAALQRAIDAGHRNIRLRGGKGLGTGGIYRIGSRPFTGTIEGAPSNSSNVLDYIEGRGNLSTTAGAPAHGLRLIGDGRSLTRVQQTDNFLFSHNSLSEDVADNLLGFTIEIMTLVGLGGPAVQTGHICAFSGVTRFVARDVAFLAFQGDGICDWMGPRPDTVRHNVDHLVQDCLFDGIDQGNRNAISIEDCVGVRILDSDFRNCSTPTDAVSVAAIDIEPRDRASYAIDDILIQGNSFYNLGRAAVAFYLNDPESYTSKPSGFRMLDNNIEKAFRGVDMSGGFLQNLTIQSRHQVIVSRNTMKNVEEPLRCRGILGLDFTHNHIDDAGSLKLGIDGTGLENREVRIEHNMIARAGRTLGAILLVDDGCQDCSFSFNEIYDGGRTDNLGGWVMLGRYGACGLRLNHNRLRNRAGRIKAFAQIGDSVTVRAGAQKIGNELYDTAMIAADNFNPPPPQIGLRYTQTLTGTVAANSTTYYDVGISGVTADKAFAVKFDQYNDVNAVLDLSVAALRYNVVRVILRNTGAAWTIPNGASFTITEVL